MLTPAVSALQRQLREIHHCFQTSAGQGSLPQLPGHLSDISRPPHQDQGFLPQLPGHPGGDTQPLPQDPALSFSALDTVFPHLLHSPGSGGQEAGHVQLEGLEASRPPSGGTGHPVLL